MWDPKSPWHDPRVRKAASLALDRKALNEAETLGASRLNGSFVPHNLEFALPIDPHAYDPAQAKKLLAEAGYPNGFDAGELHPSPPYFGTGEAVAGYLQAVGIRTRMRTMERAAFISAWGAKKLKGVCMCTVGVYGNAATRMAQYVPSAEPTLMAGGRTWTRCTSSRRGRPIGRSARRCSTRSSRPSPSASASR